MERFEHTFEPVFNENSRILILGTFPSVKSREGSFYYHNPRNRFWELLSILLKAPRPLTIPEKKALLLSRGIALWDVVQSCDIKGSSDSSIQNVIPNDLDKILKKAKIRAIYGNGATACRLYTRYFNDGGVKPDRPAIIPLPSTSPANAAFSMERLLEEWLVILDQIP